MQFIITSTWTLIFLLFSVSASAELYEIRAIGATTPSGPGGTSSVTTSDWSVIFDDTGDQLLQVTEIVSFSGATVTTSFGGPYEYNSIIGSPNIIGVSTESGSLGPCCWWFDGPVIAVPGGDGWFPDRWSAYQIELYAVSPVDLLSELATQVIALNLDTGVGNALDRRLQNVLSALDRAQSGDNPAAIGMLYSFVNTVEAQRGSSLTNEQADGLSTSAGAIINILERQ